MRILATIALLFSAQAFACPDLTGAFTCTYQDGSSEQVTITQSVNNGVTVYNYNGSDIPADNVAYPMQDDESVRNATLRSWCDATTLKSHMLGKYFDNGTEFGDIDMTIDMTIESNNFKSVSNGTLKGTDGSNYPLNGETTCTRN